MEIMTNWEPESWSRMTKGGVHFLLSCRSVAPWGQRWSYVATARGRWKGITHRWYSITYSQRDYAMSAADAEARLHGGWA